ncbi:MAG: pentapeptide repeat-containing protein [Microcoleaceae cyanobacterium]
MKGRQVLLLYRKGRRDFRGQNLRGQSLRGQNLSGADFSYCDLQGANFYKANLQNSQFRGVKTGLRKRWKIILLLISWLLSVLSSLGLVLISYFTLLVLNLSNPNDSTVGWNTVLLTIAFVFIAIRQLIGGSFGTIAATIIVAVIGIITSASAGMIQMATFIGTLGISSALAGFAIAVVLTSAVAFAVAFLVSPIAALILATARTITVAITASTIASYFSGEVGAVVVASAVSVSFFFDYLGWRSLYGNGRYAGIQTIAVNLAAVGGTSFRRTNLTDADFTNAIIPSTDFSQAKLDRTCWKNVRYFDRIRTRNTYLKSRYIRELLQSGKGENRNFNHQDLRGLNLKGANLKNASFIGANLSHSNLKNANLSGARLIRTRLDKTNLTNAILTRAFIQNWIVTTRTKLDGIQCDYIFLRLPSPDNLDQNPHRQPEDWNRNFQPGEFTELTLQKLYNRSDPNATQIQPIVTTLQTEYYPVSSPISQIEIQEILKDWIKLITEIETEATADIQLKSVIEILNQIEDNFQLKPEDIQRLKLIESLKQERSVKIALFILLVLSQMSVDQSQTQTQTSSSISR